MMNKIVVVEFALLLICKNFSRKASLHPYVFWLYDTCIYNYQVNSSGIYITICYLVLD